MGGWGVYLKARKAGKSKKEALDLFARAANSAQQSADLAEQSNFQRGGSLAKLFTMFATTPNQYLRKEIGAIRNFRDGRISAGQAAKQLLIYHFMLPMIFQFISDFGKFKPDEQLRAAIFGNLNGLFIIGDMIDAILRKALKMKVYPDRIPIMSVPLDDINKALFSIDWDDITDEDVHDAVRGALGVAGFGARIPLKEIENMIQGLRKIYEGEYRDGVGGALGWTEHALKTEDEGPF